MTSRQRMSGRAAAALVALLVGAGADPLRPTPRFEGKTIPDPPEQAEPWTPPETKLPRFLVRASAALFEAGMADPRGCAYREVELGDDYLSRTHGFVLPEVEGEAERFAVGWDGVIYPASSVGPEADLEADVRVTAEALKKSREEAEAPGSRRLGQAGGFPVSFGGIYQGQAGGAAAVASLSPLKLCLLLRLGRADLAEALFAAGTTWTPDTPRPDLTDYHITFLTLAQEWAGIVNARLRAAHQRGDDGVALDAARRLSAFQKAVDANAEAMGFQRPEPRPRFGAPAPDGPASYLGGLDELPALLADQERRATGPPRGPIPGRGGDPSERVAALIRDFDQIHVVQMSSPGSANPGTAPLVAQVVAEGDAAVGPLLDALESDTRLTRSMTMGRGGGPGHIQPVTDALYTALGRILRTNDFLGQNGRGGDYEALRTPEGRKRLAAAIRAFWEKNRAVPLVERWFRTLQDDQAGADRWMEAAVGLVQPADQDGAPPFWSHGARPRRPADPPMKGEPLRARTDPSVTDLLIRRVGDLAAAGNPLSFPDPELGRACQLALILARWDERASLPTLEALMTTCRERSANVPPGHQGDLGYGASIAQFTLIRARNGDRKALDEYAAWLKTIGPKSIEHSPFAALEPMWRYPDHPSIGAAARAMFLDPKSPWLPLVPRDPNQVLFHFEEPISSPLLCVLELREAVIEALADRAPAGTARRLKEGGVQFAMKSGTNGGFGGRMRVPTPDVPVGVDVPFRACDVVAWKLSTVEGAPECELYWPEARRDRAVAACVEFLRRYGWRFTAEAPSGQNDFPHGRAHLRFPVLGRPATAEDVRRGRAVFSLEDEGEARVVTLPMTLPIAAKWVTLREFPVDVQYGDGSIHRDYLQDGWVWQAEEVRRGDRWERSYGFVGHATIARVPASEIEFQPDRFRESALPGGLTARLELSRSPEGGYRPGDKIVATLRLRNVQGVDRAVPAGFIRPTDDGKPALRRGVALELFDVPRNPEGPIIPTAAPPRAREPSRAAHFDPDGASRTLAPLESFEAMRLELADWFGLLAPGSYRLHITIAEEAGVGAGMSNDIYFTVAEPDERQP